MFEFGYKLFLKGVEMSKFFDFKIALLVAILLSSSSNVSADLNCTEQPACTDLGYSTSDVDNCESYIYCPFDTSYKACTSISCTDHWLFNCPTNAKSCTKCSAGGHTLYKVTECEDGYTAVYSTYADRSTSTLSSTIGGTTITGNVVSVATEYISDCVADCSDYTLTACIDNASCDECTQDGVTTYKFLSCNDNYTQSEDDGGNIVCNRDGAISGDLGDFAQVTWKCLAGQYYCTKNSIDWECLDEYPCLKTSSGLQTSCEWACLEETQVKDDTITGNNSSSSGSIIGSIAMDCDDECLQSNSCECYKCQNPDYCINNYNPACCATEDAENTVQDTVL